MKTKIIFFIRVLIPVFLAGQQIIAQTIVTGGSSLVIATGGKLVSTQNLVVNNGGNLLVTGTLALKKDLINQNVAVDNLGTGTIEFSGSVNQNLTGQNMMQDVTVNNAAGVTIGGATTFNGTMELNAGKVTIGSNNLVMGINAVFAGTPSEAAMIVPTGAGQIIKWFYGSFTGTYTFPVGDTTGTAEYSPVILSFTQAQVNNTGYLTLNLFNRKYPDPAITGNYLKRYWTLSATDFASFNCNATFQYVPADVTGTEAVLSCSKVNPLPWVTYGLTNTATHQLSATGLTTFSSFTGLKSTTTPANQELANINIGDGVSNCFDATQVLTVAGNGTTFIVGNHGIVILIAGQKISMLPGTRVFQGGYLHGFISGNGNYCASLSNQLVNNPDAGGDVMTTVPEIANNRQVRVYPNPTSGMFTVELTGAEKTGLSRIEIYSMNGVKVKTEVLHGELKHQCSGADLMPGIYFIRLYTENQVETVKLIKD